MMTQLLKLICLYAALAGGSAVAQFNPVYVDDSPVAGELLREARDQASSNPGEAARLYQELLDDYALRLIPADQTATLDMDRFTAVRLSVLDELLQQDEVLQRHRSIELAQAMRLHEAGEFERLALTRPWTEPGLDALLRVAQQRLEAARFYAAVDLLSLVTEHPDFHDQPRAQRFAWYMQALASHYRGDGAGYDAARASLKDLAESENLLTALATLVEAGSGPDITVSITSLETGTASALDQLVAKEIWTVPLEESLFNRRNTEDARVPVRRATEQMQAGGYLMAATPTITDDTVYVNQGHHIKALDRFTGSPRWPEFVDRHTLTIIDRDDDYARDLSVVAVLDDALVTLTGHAHATSRSNDAQVLCLDADTGEQRWATQLDGIGGEDEYEGLFPYSAPIIAEGRVYVLARRVSAQSVTSTYLVSLELATGHLQWIRHIASSGSIRRAARPFSTLVYQQGDLYLKTAVGAVARIRASTGQTRWLHRFTVPLNPSSQEQNRTPWETASPVMNERHVFTLLEGDNRLLVLDRETGEIVSSHDTSTGVWRSPSYLLADSNTLFAVGREIRAFDMNALEQPLWRLRDLSGETPIGDIRGRVHLVRDDETAHALIVPTLDGVLLVEADSGEVVNELDVSPGNPVAADSQLVLADDESVRAYMALDRAVQLLDDRIDAVPDDPEPALALLRLASRIGDAELVLASATAARRAIADVSDADTAETLQTRLFDMLLSVDVAAMDERAGRDVMHMLGEVVTAPWQKLEYLLARGQWQQQHAPAEAVDTYHSIFVDEQLASLHRTDDFITRAGRSWAQRRLALLIEIHGEALYAANAEGAAQQLSVLAADGADLTELHELAGSYPLSDAAVTAASHAAEVADDDNGRRTLGVLVDLYRQAEQAPGSASDRVVRLAQAIGQLCDRHGWQVPEAIERELGATSDARTAMQPPRIGTQQGEPTLLQGAVLAADAELGLLIFEPGVVRLLDSASHEQQWAMEVGTIQPRVLWFDAQRIVLWFVQEGGNVARAAMVTTAEGEHRWTTPLLSHHLEAPRSRRSSRGAVRAGLNEVEPGDVLALCDGRQLVLVQRNGGVASFGLDDASSPSWVEDGMLNDVHHAQLADGLLVLAGLASDDSPAMLAVDARSGIRVHERETILPRSHEAVRWIIPAGPGLTAIGTAAGIEMWNLYTGDLVWMNGSDAAGNVVHAQPAGRRLVLATQEQAVQTIDVADGHLASSHASPPDVSEPSELVDIRPDARTGQVLAMFTQRVVWYDKQGEIAGADALSGERDYRWVLPAADRTLLVSARQPRQELVPGGNRRRTNYTYRVYPLSNNGRLLDEAAELSGLDGPLRTMHLIDGWLLATGRDVTAAIPYPVE